MKRLLMIIPAMLQFAAITVSAHPAPAKTPTFFPLAQGNYWVYRTVFQTMTITRRQTVVSTTTRNGTITAAVRSQQRLGSGNPQGESMLTYIADAHGIYLGLPKGRRQLLLPLPVKVGAHWTQTVMVGPPGQRTRSTEHYWIVTRGPARVANHQFHDTIDVAYGTCPGHVSPSVQHCATTQALYAANVGQVQVASVGEPVTRLIKYHVK